MKKIILNSEDIINKIKRISFEIIEKNINENEIYLVGLMPNGKYLSENISKYISENSNIIVSGKGSDIIFKCNYFLYCNCSLLYSF